MEKEQEIMLKRARLVAGRGKADALINQDTLSVVGFLLVPEKYAIAGSYVTEVLPLTEITPIPGAPAFIMGVINLRGKIVSIVNLKIKFSLKEKGLTYFNKVIILRNENMEFGIVADAITGTQNLELDNLSPPPLTLSSVVAQLVIGVSSDGLIMLDAQRMLNSNQFVINQKSK